MLLHHVAPITKTCSNEAKFDQSSISPQLSFSWLQFREFAYASKMMPAIKPDVWKYKAIYLIKTQIIINLPMHHKVALAMIELIFGNSDYAN